MKKLFLVLVVICLFCSGCGQGDSDMQGSTGPVVAVVPKSLDHVFWKSVEIGARKADSELDINFIWRGSKVEDVDDQIKIVNGFVKDKVDAIVLAPVDDEKLVPCVENAVKNGIKVVIIDSELKTDVYTSFIATDNYEAGRLCAKQVKKMINGKGRVLVVHFGANSGSTINRERGFADYMKKHARKIKVINIDRAVGVTVESANLATQEVLKREKRFDAIFTPNESTATGTLKALITTKKAGTVKVMGFDSSNDLLTALDDGYMHALAIQDPVAMGYKGVLSAYNAINGLAVDKRIDTGISIVETGTF